MIAAVTNSKSEASVSDQLHYHSDYVLIRQKSQQLAGKATVPDSVICSCQVDNTVFFLASKESSM